MVFAAYLRVFEPLAAFAESEREQWERARADSGEVPAYRGRDLRRRTGLGVHAERPGDGAFVRRVDDTVLVCPWDTRLRETQSALAFRQAFHEEIAAAFIPEREAKRAAAELERLQSAGRRNHILVHSWQVPVRWFLPFSPDDRHLVERRHGPGIVYETSLVEGLARVQRALKVLEDVGFDEYRVHQVEELADWLSGFHRRSLVQLDYGTVAELYSPQELVTDDSAADAWASLKALGEGDAQLSFQHYSRLTERFGRGRSLAVSS